LLAAFGAASAQSSVTLYGKADVFYGTDTQTHSFPNGNSVKSTTSGFLGAANGSRWGIRGSEALANGLRANFAIESGLNIAEPSAATNAVTGVRRATVGLSGNFGNVDFGRFLSPMVAVAGGYDVDGINGLATSSHFAAAIRRNNAVTYTSPSMSGFTVMAQFAGNKTKQTNTPVTTATVPPAAFYPFATIAGTLNTSGTTQVADSGMGLSASYNAGQLSLAAAYDSGKAVNSTNGVSAAAYKTNAILLGGTYNFGVAKLFANYGTQNVSGASSAAMPGSTRAKQLNLGVSVPFGATTLIAGVGKNSGSNTIGAGINNKVSGTDAILGLNYSLSPRTTVFFRTGSVNKYNYTDTVTGAAIGSSKQSKTAIGLDHNF
jgi:predicted porin